FFFFSSRRRHTRSKRDWSSDVCFPILTRRIPVDESGAPAGGAYYGPFASRRSAQAFAERILDLFKVRRCQIKIRRDPTFPGCLYSEMKMRSEERRVGKECKYVWSAEP